MTDDHLLGARVERTTTRFGAFTTWAKTCSVRLFADDGTVRATHPMSSAGDGHFETTVDGEGHGTLYAFILDDRQLTDPYARFLPLGVHRPAMVIEPHYAWRFGHGGDRPLSEHVIYELHVGTFTEEGTYAAARKHFDDLSRLGVTAIELMPIAAFPGARGWGYDGVAHYALVAPYGTPDELRAFGSRLTEDISIDAYCAASMLRGRSRAQPAASPIEGRTRQWGG